MAVVFLKVFFGRAPFENQNNVEEFKNSQIAEIFFFSPNGDRSGTTG